MDRGGNWTILVMGEEQEVMSPPGVRPPYSDDGFNGDADLAGDNEDPGDLRDDIALPEGAPVPATEGEEWAYSRTTGGDIPTQVVGPYGTPGPMTGSYRAIKAYSPPDEVKGDATGGFDAAMAVVKLEGVSYGRGAAGNGWQGNGELGVKAMATISGLVL